MKKIVIIFIQGLVFYRFISTWQVVEDSTEQYLEVECGEFLIEMDLVDIANLETLTKEELATIIFNKYL